MDPPTSLWGWKTFPGATGEGPGEHYPTVARAGVLTSGRRALLYDELPKSPHHAKYWVKASLRRNAPPY